MNYELAQWLLSLVVMGVVAWGAIVITSGYEETIEELREGQVKHGGVGLSEVYINISPEVFFLIRTALAAATFFLFAMAIPLIFAAGVAVGAYFLPKVYLNKLKRERVIKVEQQLVEGLELLGNSLKSGLTLPQATELLVREFPDPIAQEFSLVLGETRLGLDFNDALANMAERLNSNIVRVLAAGVSITKRCGGDITEIFSNIAATIRDQAVIEGKLDSVTAQGRFQGLILGTMPFALIVLLYFVDRSHVETLFGYQLGMWAVALVVVMVGMAQLWIKKLLDIDV